MNSIKNMNRIGFYDGCCVENNVINFFEQHIKNFPNRTALMWINDHVKLNAGKEINNTLPHDSINYYDFYDSIKRISRGLKDIGIEKGDRVIIFLPMSLQLYQTMFAVQKIGAIAVFLDSWARRDQLGESSKTVTPKCIISFEMAFNFGKQIPELNSIPIKIVVGQHIGEYNATYESLLKCLPDESITPVEGKDTALITFTTGSTGTPKGADRTHEFLAAQHYALDEVLPYKDSDIDMPAFPIFSLNNMGAGVTTVLPGCNVAQPSPNDPIILASQFLSCNINCATLSISMISGLIDYSKKNKISFDHIQRIATGGAPISNDLLKDFIEIAPNAKIWILYGSTEAEPIAHIEARDILYPAYKNEPQIDYEEEGVNVGHFAEGIEAKFIKIHKDRIELENDNWEPWELPKGEIGELVITGLHVCKQYYNNIEVTKDTKITESSGKVWHRTSDLAYLDKHDQVWLVGRVNNIIIRKGQPLFPVKVEILLKKLSFVKKSAYLGVPDNELGEKTYAIISPDRPLNEIDLGITKEKIRNVLNSYKIPADEILILEDIPMDPRHHSKVEYQILRDKIIKGDI